MHAGVLPVILRQSLCCCALISDTSSFSRLAAWIGLRNLQIYVVSYTSIVASVCHVLLNLFSDQVGGQAAQSRGHASLNH